MSEAKPVPATSHAHAVDPVKEGKLSEASKTLTDHYARAKAAQLQKQAAARAQPTDMSYARNVQMDGKKNQLDRASQNVSSQFERAKTAQLEKAQEPISMKAPAPDAQMHLRPGGQLQKDVDLPIRGQELSAYAKQVRGLQEAAKNRQPERTSKCEG